MKSIRSFRKICITCVTLVIFSGSAILMTGCKTAALVGAIAGAATVGAVVVIAKYKASAQQKAVAEEQARRVVARAANPHSERHRAQKQAAAQKKIADLEGEYAKRIAQAQRSKAAAGSAASGASVAELEAEKKRALDKAQADAAAEMAALDSERHSLAGNSSRGLKMDTAPSAADSVPVASTHDREALTASAAAHLPKYIAVAVPPQGIAAEAGGKSTVMLWDTRHQRMATDDVYVLKNEVLAGATVKLNGVKALFASAQ